ncbi:hypothetical protein Tco_0276591 [Tanacetum coccineum]
MANNSQKWHDGSKSRRMSSDNSEGIAAITNKLDSLGRDMKKLKENVKSIEEVKYREFGRPFLNNNGNGARYRVGPPGYYTRVDNQPQSGERKPSLTEIITKYMEESVKKEAEHDEWLRKFQESTKMNQKHHDEIIHNLESKVRALTGEVEGRATRTKLGEYKAIFTKEGLPLYTPFYYSPKEIEHFSVDLSFSDEEETKKLEEVKEVSSQHEPSHQKEGLVHKAMESLKKIKVNRPFLKEIRQTDDYAKYMKNLVENKSRTLKNEGVKMNIRCSTILHNQLPFKEQDPRSFTLPCSIGKLTYDALADLGASISIMPFSMFKSGTVIDVEDLDGIVDYLELKSHDNFIDTDDEAYKERMCELLGMTYRTPPPILIEKVELPRIGATVAVIRAELMQEMDTVGSVQKEA